MTPLKKALRATLVAALSFGPACGGAEPTAIVEARSQKVRATPVVPDEERAAVRAGNMTFALDVFRTVDKKDENVVFSPMSISVALAMTYAGARGETETQMAEALEFKLPQSKLHPTFNWLDQELENRGQGTKGADGGPFRLKMVNALWAEKEDFVLQPAFLDVQAEHYGAGVNLANFRSAPDDERVRINEWVEKETASRIKDLIPPKVINDGTRLVLSNAVYLNAAWKHPFDDGTEDAAFIAVDGSPTTVKMMRLEASLRAADGEGYKAVVLPYEDERLSMLLVVPDEGAYEMFESTLSEAKLAEIEASLQQQAAIVTAPRFKIDFPLNLKDVLSELGMPIAFDEAKADFSGISTSTSLYIQAALHRAFISVAEKGTEAAAATAVIIGTESAPAGLLVDANRPFIFVLRDEPTGSILFIGRVMKPKA